MKNSNFDLVRRPCERTYTHKHRLKKKIEQKATQYKIDAPNKRKFNLY